MPIEANMLHPACLVLALCLGQTGETPTEESKAEAPASEPWFLMRELQPTWVGAWLKQHNVDVYGWTDMSFTASSMNGDQLPMGFNYRANQFLLQQNWLRIEQAVKTDGSTPSFGFRSDTILPGSDYRFTVARGLFDSQLTAHNGQPNIYGIDPIQFYGEAYLPNIGKGLDVKVGRFFSQYGVESNDAPSNVLLSHAYTFIYNPFTHTGVLGTLKLNDRWSVQAGMTLGSDIFINRADMATGIGSVKWVAGDGKTSLQFAFILGPGQYEQAQNFNNPQVLDFIGVHKLNSRFTYTVEKLLGFTSNVPGIGNAQWFGIVNYLTCEFTPTVSGTTRLEFFEDRQGFRTGSQGLYSVLTTGLNFRPHRAVIIRPELRWDYNGENAPFDGRHGLFTAATDIILRW